MAARCLLCWMVMAACEHEPVVSPNLPEADTTDTGGDGGGSGTDKLPPCDPDSVYFEAQLLPIFISNCAKSGCHDAATAEIGVIMTDFQHINQTADVRPFDPDGSDLYEVITTTDPEKHMPPPPEVPLTDEQIALIRKWIAQGAQDLHCQEESTGCETTNVSFAQTVLPLFQRSCIGCHGSTVANSGIRLHTYDNVVKAIATGRILGVIKHESGYPQMPQGGNKLPDCEIAQIEAWINQGTLNN